MTRYIFVSLHYYDAILSCGGTIAGLCKQGAMCSVITVFGGGPDLRYRLSTVAREYLAEDLGQSEKDITFSSCWDFLRIREEEDRRDKCSLIQMSFTEELKRGLLCYRIRTF